MYTGGGRGGYGGPPHKALPTPPLKSLPNVPQRTNAERRRTQRRIISEQEAFARVSGSQDPQVINRLLQSTHPNGEQPHAGPPGPTSPRGQGPTYPIPPNLMNRGGGGGGGGPPMRGGPAVRRPGRGGKMGRPTGPPQMGQNQNAPNSNSNSSDAEPAPGRFCPPPSRGRPAGPPQAGMQQAPPSNSNYNQAPRPALPAGPPPTSFGQTVFQPPIPQQPPPADAPVVHQHQLNTHDQSDDSDDFSDDDYSNNNNNSFQQQQQPQEDDWNSDPSPDSDPEEENEAEMAEERQSGGEEADMDARASQSETYCEYYNEEEEVIEIDGAKALALWDFDADRDTDLNFKRGDVITVIRRYSNGWWEGELNGNIGDFPCNFVQLEDDIPTSDTEADEEDDDDNEEYSPAPSEPQQPTTNPIAAAAAASVASKPAKSGLSQSTGHSAPKATQEKPRSDTGAMMATTGHHVRERPVKMGFLTKKGHRRKNWKVRYFILLPKKLQYYSSAQEFESGKKCKGTVPLSRFTRVRVAPEMKKSNCFAVEDASRPFILYIVAPTGEEMISWMEQIAVAYNQQ